MKFEVVWSTAASAAAAALVTALVAVLVVGGWFKGRRGKALGIDFTPSRRAGTPIIDIEVTVHNRTDEPLWLTSVTLLVPAGRLFRPGRETDVYRMGGALPVYERFGPTGITAQGKVVSLPTNSSVFHLRMEPPPYWRGGDIQLSFAMQTGASTRHLNPVLITRSVDGWDPDPQV